MPANKKAYSDGKGSKTPYNLSAFIFDNTLPKKHWKEPIKKGVLLWNKAFERLDIKMF